MSKMLQPFKTAFWARTWFQSTFYAKYRSSWMRSWFMEQAAQAKRQPVWWNRLEKWSISSLRKFLIAWNRASLHSPSQASSVSMLIHFHKMPIQLAQSIKGDRILFQACTYLGISWKKVNMVAVNMSNLKEPIICVKS